MRINRLTGTSIGLICALVILSSCSLMNRKEPTSPSDTASVQPSASASASQTSAQPSVSPSNLPKAPKLTSSASRIDCQDSPGYIMWQADHTFGEVSMKIADLQCEMGGPKFGQVIEIFILSNGTWASQGLASGPDISVRTIGECLDDLVNKISCPAQALSEAGNPLDGNLVITIDSQNTTWQFNAN